MNLVKFYFVYCGNLQEREIIKELKPPNLLLSYYYFKHKSMKEIIESLGYKPNIMLDSGAYSAYNSGKAINIFEYMDYIRENESHLECYMASDVMKNGEETFENFVFMKESGLNPVPIFHYKTDEIWLEKYYELGERFVALGSTVPEPRKYLVRMWINELAVRFHDLSFHVLGTSRREIIDYCDVWSCDSTGWIRTAILRGKTRAERDSFAKSYMKRLMEITC